MSSTFKTSILDPTMPPSRWRSIRWTIESTSKSIGTQGSYEWSWNRLVRGCRSCILWTIFIEIWSLRTFYWTWSPCKSVSSTSTEVTTSLWRTSGWWKGPQAISPEMMTYLLAVLLGRLCVCLHHPGERHGDGRILGNPVWKREPG